MSTKDIITIVTLSLTITTIIQSILYNFWVLPKINKNLKLFESKLKKEDLLNEKRWQMKQSACLKALNIADAILSNYKYPNADKSSIKPGKITTEEVRSCFNELACTCDKADVIEILKKILFADAVRPDIIVDLRNAVRKELEFGNNDFDKDRERAFVGRVVGDPELNKDI